METHSDVPHSKHLLVSLLAECCITICDIRTTLNLRFAFAGITTVISIVKSSLLKLTTDHCKHARLVQWLASDCKTTRPYIETPLGECNLIIKSSIKRLIGRPCLDTLPTFQSESNNAMNEYQPICNPFTRHSNDMKI